MAPLNSNSSAINLLNKVVGQIDGRHPLGMSLKDGNGLLNDTNDFIFSRTPKFKLHVNLLNHP